MQLINDLKEMQFTEAEAKIYTTLLKHGSSTGYEISKHSGIARSKIYNHLEELVRKGAIESSNIEKNTVYKAISPRELAELKRMSMNITLKSFEYFASNIAKVEENSGIWEIEDYNRLILKAKDLIEKAEKSLYIQVWASDLSDDLVNLINTKIDSLKKTVVILYDENQDYNTSLKKFFPHGFEMERLEDMNHRWITVISDEKILLYSGILFNNEVSGIYTENKILSFFAKEYVQHDAYCLKLINKFYDDLVKEDGKGLKEIRNIYD